MLNKEIWISDIVEKFFADNSFMSKSVDHSAFVENHTVHMPQAGTPGSIVKDLTSFPASISQRTDSELTYDLSTFYALPLLLQNAEQVELSYDKRTSLTNQVKNALQEAVANAILYSWVPTSSPTTIRTTGSSVDATIPSATGTRKAISLADIMTVKRTFDMQGVPMEGRTILLDADMYNQLLSEMTDAATMNFLAGADPERGVLGKYLGFEFMMRMQVLKTATGGSLKDWSASAAATDCAAGLAWQKDCVSRAMGAVDLFEKEKDPTYYGDIFSFSMRAGGSPIRADKKGIILISQAQIA